jgi:protein-S-isoprenylcysteine O-methyltransferase Ste14
LVYSRSPQFFRGLLRERLQGNCGLMRRSGADHRLIRSGPYALVCNPIYTSMLLVLCATAVIIAGWKLFLAALLLFVMGTEIRVRIEETLLASHFGEEFKEYKRNVPAYIPFL